MQSECGGSLHHSGCYGSLMITFGSAWHCLQLQDLCLLTFYSNQEINRHCRVWDTLSASELPCWPEPVDSCCHEWIQGRLSFLVFHRGCPNSNCYNILSFRTCQVPGIFSQGQQRQLSCPRVMCFCRTSKENQKLFTVLPCFPKQPPELCWNASRTVTVLQGTSAHQLWGDKKAKKT